MKRIDLIKQKERRTRIMRKIPGTIGAFLVLLFVVFSSGAAYADTISTLTMKITADGVTVVIGDNSASDTDSRPGYISYSGFVGSFFFQSTTAFSVSGTDLSGTNLNLSLTSQIGHFGSTADQIVLELDDTATYPVTVTSLSGNVTATTIGGTGTFQTSVDNSSLFAGNGVPITTGSVSQSVQMNESNPSLHSAVATIAFTGAGGSENFTFTSVADPPPSIPSMPEPLSVLLLGPGLISLGIWRKKRGRNA